MSNKAYTELLETLAKQGFRLSPIDSEENEPKKEDDEQNHLEC